MPVNPPPPTLRTSPWVSRLGRAAVVVLVVGAVLTPVTLVNSALPFWLLPVGIVLISLGVVLGAVWTLIRLVAASVHVEARPRDDGR